MRHTARLWVCRLTTLLVSGVLASAIAITEHTESFSPSLSCENSPLRISLLVLLDSSGSVTPWEYRHFLLLLSRLSGRLNWGPTQAALVSVSEDPQLVWPFGQHRATWESLPGQLQQRFGDSNAGQAFRWAQTVFRQVDRQTDSQVLLWLTDGHSTDDVISPAQALKKELGVRVLMVISGHGGRGVSEVSSEGGSIFADPQNIPELAGQLCHMITGSVPSVSPSLAISHPQPTSLPVSWPPVALAPLKHPFLMVQANHKWRERALWRQELGRETHSATLWNLTTSRRQKPLFVNITTSAYTLTGISAIKRGSRSLYLSLPPSTPSLSHYHLIYGAPGSGLKPRSLKVSGSRRGVWLTSLTPDTDYLITVTAHYHEGSTAPISLRAKTLTERFTPPTHLMLTDITSSSMTASWAEPPGRQDVTQYRVRHLTGSGQEVTSLRLPGHTRTVFLRGLREGARHRVCVSAEYRPGRSRETCAEETTRRAPVMQCCHLPYWCQVLVSSSRCRK
ncbi:von Willebrand factor A domain-containing protein 1-like [Lepisosteus oculatus]|uniref:von Willebrand factor A domain-containing protein 1-like n=1 Tax=Lepisosteus oculatus TaxID=7918 RepID=UPI0035F50DDA